MKRITQLFETFLKFCRDEYGLSEADLRVTYPDNAWNTLTWSYWLLLDFIAFDLQKPEEISRLFWKLKSARSLNRFSNHCDLTRKIWLYSKMMKIDNRERVLISEVGPCGFDVLVAKVAGYNEIHVYDACEDYLKASQFVWGDHVSKYIISSSDVFDFKSYLSKEWSIVISGFSHDDLNTKFLNYPYRLSVEEKPHFSSHLKQLNYGDVLTFKKALGQWGKCASTDTRLNVMANLP